MGTMFALKIFYVLRRGASAESIFLSDRVELELSLALPSDYVFLFAIPLGFFRVARPKGVHHLDGWARLRLRNDFRNKGRTRLRRNMGTVLYKLGAR